MNKVRRDGVSALISQLGDIRGEISKIYDQEKHDLDAVDSFKDSEKFDTLTDHVWALESAGLHVGSVIEHLISISRTTTVGLHRSSEDWYPYEVLND